MAVFVGQDGIAVLVCKAKDAYVQALAGAHPQVQILDLMIHPGVFILLYFLVGFPLLVEMSWCST